MSPDTPVFFGFGEYLASLALMVLAWTIADPRYRFRVTTAPVPMDRLTFTAVGGIGLLTLMTDLWRVQEWPVPVGPLPPAVWQAILGGAFLSTFLAWAWFAFIRPPVYGRWNAQRYAETLYRMIMKGSPPQLAIAADELARSAKAIVKHASNRSKWEAPKQEDRENVTAYADEILLLVADRRFCREMVGSSPNTIGALFHAMRKSKKYGIPIDLFARNIVRAAIANRDSFLYHESSGYDSGLLGYHKPLTTIMFSDFDAIEEIGIMMEPGYFEAKEWAPDQWAAYSRIVLTALRTFAERGFWWGHGFPFTGAMGMMKHAISDLYKLDGVEDSPWDDPIQARLRVVVDFVQEAVKILEDVGVPAGLARRVQDPLSPKATIYDQLAELISEIVFAAAGVTSPRGLCWWIQHNSVWGELTRRSDARGSAWGVVLFKVRRLLYDDIAELTRFPNFKGARILGFCLNVMGLELSAADHRKEMRPLHCAVLRWTSANFAKLHKGNPRVAEACLVTDMTYDEPRSRLVRTFPAEGLRLEPHHVYLELDPLPDSRFEARVPAGDT